MSDAPKTVAPNETPSAALIGCMDLLERPVSGSQIPLDVRARRDSVMRMTQQLWNTTEPPKDGTTIIVVGRVIWSDEFSTCVDPFVAAVRWFKDQSNYEGWHFDRDGMTVARTLDDDVKIDWWANYPKEVA